MVGILKQKTEMGQEQNAKLAKLTTLGEQKSDEIDQRRMNTLAKLNSCCGLCWVTRVILIKKTEKEIHIFAKLAKLNSCGRTFWYKSVKHSENMLTQLIVFPKKIIAALYKNHFCVTFPWASHGP